MASQDIWIIIVTIQFVMLLVVVVYMMSKPRSIGTIAPHVNLRMRDSQDVYEAQERAIHTFPYHTPFWSQPMRGPTLNVSTSCTYTTPFRTYQPSHQTRADFQTRDTPTRKISLTSSIFASASKSQPVPILYKGGRYRHLDGAAE
jgi:hypothetical protein